MSKKVNPTVTELIHFLEDSPTAWHAVENLQKQFLKEGFEILREEEEWKLKPGGKYIAKRNGSSFCAFILPLKKPLGIDIAASHTDSPGLKLKPHPEFLKGQMGMLGVEVYGAPLLSSWLNRDLGVAGRVVYLDKMGHLKESLIKWADWPVIIPQLAIHLDRQVNETGLLLNKQEHLSPLACLDGLNEKFSFLDTILNKTIAYKTLLGADLFLYPLEKPAYLGNDHELIAAYRLDSLASVHAISVGLLASSSVDPQRIKMAVFWDNEEIGSGTAHGAGSPFLMQMMERLTLALKLSREEFLRLTRQSRCLSVDLAHASHPNHLEKHDPQHPIGLGQGIVLKSNAQQRYATDARSAAMITELCLKLKLPLQHFVSRNDIPCGSTIGPIQAALSGIPTVDLGIPQLSMHSIREVIAVKDHLDLCHLLTGFFKNH